MQKVVDYKLVKSSTTDGLTEQVKAEMQAGWVPSGIVIKFHENLIQAMVKFEEALEQ